MVLGRFRSKSIRFAFIAVLTTCVLSISAPSQTNGPPDLNNTLSLWIHPVKGTDIEIAPMIKAGDPTPGRWSAVPNDLFNGILSRSGIVPCVSDPMSMVDSDGKAKPGHDGLLQAIDASEVVNSSGTRSTFGWFVRVTQDTEDAEPQPFEFFILMSYDLVHDKKSGKDICAFEVFLFGPIPRVGSPAETWLHYGGIDTTLGAPLLAGLVVNGDGKSLDAVPFEIARVRNYKNDAPADEQVRPGVVKQGEGCLRCHERETKRSPESTTPFPWVYDFNKPPKLEVETEIKGVLNPSAEGTPSPGAAPQQSAPGTSAPPAGASNNAPFSPATAKPDRTSSPTHRTTGCKSCRGVARRLNDAIDLLAAELGDPQSSDQSILDQRASVAELSSMLDSCEKTCKDSSADTNGALDDVTIGVGVGMGESHDHHPHKDKYDQPGGKNGNGD